MQSLYRLDMSLSFVIKTFVVMVMLATIKLTVVSDNVSKLYNNGINNLDGIDFYESKKDLPKYKYEAQCSSESCCSWYYTRKDGSQIQRLHPYVVKDVELKRDTCPDCGYYLYWLREDI